MFALKSTGKPGASLRRLVGEARFLAFRLGLFAANNAAGFSNPTPPLSELLNGLFRL